MTALRRRPTVALAAVFTLAAVVASGGCSDDSDNTSTSPTSTSTVERPITADEASLLADILLNNFTAGGATIHATVPFGVATVTLTGDIDWVDHVGRVTLHSEVTGAEAPADFDIIWTKTAVVQQLTGLSEALVNAGRPAATWVAVPLDPSTSPLHVVLNLIDAAASIQRDNPALLLSRDIRFAGRDEIDGVGVGVFDYGRSTYWVDDEGGLRRIDAELASTNSTAQIDLSDRGPRSIDLPPDVVNAADIADIYARLTGK